MRTFRYHNWLTCLLLWIFTVQIMTAQAPLWWANQNVLIGEADDFAAMNQGQLKNLALAAVVEMDAKMASVGGAGQELRALVNQWLAQDTESDDFAVVTLGQLKAVALLFHQRLQQVGSLPSLPSWLTQQQDNYAVVNIGQAKQAFAFALPTTVVESGYSNQNNGLSNSNSPNASGDAPNSSVVMSSRTRAANPSSSLLSPTTANLTALGLGYGVTCANAQWVPEARLNLDQNPAIVADPPTLPYPYGNPRHIVTTDHWMALQADYDVSHSSVLLFKRSSPSHAWKLDKAEKVLSPLGAKSTLLTNYGMNIAIDEQPNGVVTLAITSARVGTAEEAIAIDLWRYANNTWRSELPGNKCIVPHPLVFAEDVEGMHFEHQDWIAAKASESVLEFVNFASFGATLCLQGDYLFVGSPQARSSSWLNSWFNSPNGYLQFSNTARPNDSAIPVRSGTGIVSCFRRKVSGTTVQWYLHETLDPTFYNKFRQQAPRSEALSPTEVTSLLQRINYGPLFLNPSNISGTLWYYPATYGFGSAITVNKNTIAISGMSSFGEAQDIVWVANHSIYGTGDFRPVRPPDSATPSLLASPDRHFGKSLAFVGNQLAVGASCERVDGFAPDSQPSGRIYRYEKYADSSWHMAGFQEGAAGDTGFGSTIGVAQGNLWTLSGSPLGNSESALLTFSYNDTFALGPGTETTPLHLDALVANLGQADFSGFDPQHLRPAHPTCGETSFRLTFPGQEAYYAGTLRHAAQIDLQAPAQPLFRLDFATPRQSLALSFPDGPLALATGKKFTTTPIAASSQGYLGHTSWLIGPASSTASDTAKMLKDGFTLLRCVATSRDRFTVDTVPLAIYKEPAVSKWLKLDGVVDSAGEIHAPPGIGSLEGIFKSLMEKWHKLGILIPVWSSGRPWSDGIETSNTMPSKHPYEWPAWPGKTPPAGLHYVLQMHDDTMPTSPIDEHYWSTVADGLTITERMQVRPRTSGTTRTILYRVLLVNGFGNLLRTSNIWTVPWDNDNDGLPNWFELRHGPRVNGTPSATAMTPDGTDFNGSISNVDVFQRGLENTNGSGSAVSYQLEVVQGNTSPDATNPPQLRFLGRSAEFSGTTDRKNHPFTGELTGDPNFFAHEEGSSGNYSAEMSATAQRWRDFQLADRKELVTTRFLLDLDSGNWDDAKGFTTVYSDWRDTSAAESALLDRAGVDVKQQVRPREGSLDAVHEEQSFITLRKVGNDPNTQGTSSIHRVEMLLLDQTWDLTEPPYQFYKWFDSNSLQLASVDDVINTQPGSNSRAYTVVFEFNGDSAGGHPSNIIVPKNDTCLVGTLPGGGKFLRLGRPPSKYQLHKVSLLPVEIEPDANMAGVIGDVVKSAKAGSTIKHFVTPKKSDDLNQDYVELKATGIDAAKFDEMLVWEGGEAGSSAEKRKVKRDVVGKTEVKIKAKQSGSVVKQMDVWVVWVDIKPKDKPAAPTWWHSVDTLPDGNQLLAPICEARWQFEGEVKPASVVDNTANAEIPDLKGEPATPTPETGKAHKFDGDTFLKPENKWDMSRQIRVKVLSPNIGTAEFDATWPNLFAGLPSASKIVEDYPTDTLYGNDDSSGQPNEHTDPYTGGGKILDSDKPRIHGPNHDRPAVGSTYEMRYQFREFSRLEIGGKWYRVSDPYLWRLHMKAKKVPQISIDPDDNPFDPNTDPNTNRPPITNPGFENDGSVTDETNSQW